ncbi:HAD family hydrolase [Burkholderia ubonensis]|uniref:HAD family hydrolase n=2 Tax=Burkholderia ubonensis TaxID=101571 RepID=UPI000B0C922F|nr:HAD family hydrolase [Burkholderia ubonensis]
MKMDPSATPVNAALLLDRIDKVDPQVVVFDLFDTLVARTIHPEDVKRIACDRVAHLLSFQKGGADLYARRAAIEAELCRTSVARGGDLEFHFDEMAKRLAHIAMPDGTEADWDRAVALIREVELSVEESVQHVDQEVRAVLEALHGQRKVLYLLSDFYLPASMVSRLLEKHGILGYFEKLFVSCDTMETKRSGAAYRRLLADTGVNPSAGLMIGDNRESDYRQATAAGMHAIWLDRSAEESYYRRAAAVFKDCSATSAKIREVISPSGTDAERKVFPELSLALYYFTQELHRNLVARGARDVFFLSREGQLLKHLFDDYQQRACFRGGLHIKSHYFESSRRASFMPSLGALENETFETLFRQYRRISIAEFFRNLGLDDEMDRFRAQIGPSFDERLDDLPTSAVFKDLLGNPEFKRLYKAHNDAQYRGFIEYVKGFARQDSQRTMYLVDVGWKGTIQDNIFQILSKDKSNSPFDSVDGFYVGLVASGRAGKQNRKRGLLFDSVGNHAAGYSPFNENRSLFEVVLAADHGSAKGYHVREDGRAVVERQHSNDEALLFRTRILDVQRDIEDRFKQLCEIFLRHRLAYADFVRMAIDSHARMVLSPTRSELEWFKSAYHLENFGVFELSRFRSQVRHRSLMARARETVRVLRAGRKWDFGFWPWLTLHEKTLPILPFAYRRYRYRQLRKHRGTGHL